jgi:uncharacterized membrane protein
LGVWRKYSLIRLMRRIVGRAMALVVIAGRAMDLVVIAGRGFGLIADARKDKSGDNETRTVAGTMNPIFTLAFWHQKIPL